MKFKTKVAFAFAAGLLVLLALAVMSYFRVLQSDANQEWVDHSHLVIERLDAIESDLINAETGVRGYVISGDEAYLLPYHDALSRVDQDASGVPQLVADNSSQLARFRKLSPLLATRLGELKAVVAARRKNEATAQIALRAQQGRQTMQGIHNVLSAMHGEESALLKQRIARAEVSSRQARIVILVGSVFGFLCLLAAGFFVYREMEGRHRAEEQAHWIEERFRLMVSHVREYAIFTLDTEGRVSSWNAAAKRIKGYTSEEIIGQHMRCFYTPQEIAAGRPEQLLKTAAETGAAADEGWHLRKDGSRFWANVTLTALRSDTGELRGFAEISRDLTESKRAEEQLLNRSAELEAANKELEAFSYSVSHDLRAPLRGIDGFSQALLEDYAGALDETGKDYLRRVRAGTQRMGVLIDDLLNLARVSRAEIVRETVDLSAAANAIAAVLKRAEPERTVEFRVAAGLLAQGDPRLMRIALENLLGNAWKFTSRREKASIEFGKTQNNGSSAFFVKDNGAGFDPAYAHRLFGAFQRLHAMTDFPGTGVGLATVQRIIHRHGGKIWAEGAVEQGASFYFTLQ